MCQLSDACRARFERDTDRRLIEHRLGWQRLEHSRFVRAGGPGDGVQGGAGIYMDPPELLAIMEESGLYDIRPSDTAPRE